MQIKTIDVRRTSIVPVENNNAVYEVVVCQGMEELRRMERYFLRQRIAGMVLLLVALPSFLWLGDGIAVVTLVPIALHMIFQREICRMERKIGRRWQRWRS